MASFTRTCPQGHPLNQGKVCTSCGYLGQLAVNSQLEAYQVVEQLAVYTTANVYRVMAGGTAFVMWEFRDHVTPAYRKELFARLAEAELPYVAPVLDFFTDVQPDGGSVLYVLQAESAGLAPTLNDWIRSGKADGRFVFNFVQALLALLAEAERQGWMINMLTSQHLHVTAEGSPLLAPGIYLEPWNERLPSSRVFLGFSPPEQQRTGLVYRETDRFGLAMNVFYLLTGLSPTLWHPDVPRLAPFRYLLGQELIHFYQQLLQPVNRVSIQELQQRWQRLAPVLSQRLATRPQAELTAFYQAQEAMENKQWEQAEALLQPLLMGKLHNPHSVRILAQSCWKQYRKREAMALYREALRREQLGTFYYEAAGLFYGEKAYLRALESAKKAVYRIPYVPEAYVRVAENLIALERPKDAKVWLEKAQQIKPTHAAADLLKTLSDHLFPASRATFNQTMSGGLNFNKSEMVAWDKIPQMVMAERILHLSEGQTVGAYTIKKSLQNADEAGTQHAHVYVVENKAGERFWMKASFLSFSGKERFKKEKNILKRIQHPGVPRWIDAFEHDGFGYLVQEYRPYPNLADYIAETGPLDETTTRQIFAQILDMLVYFRERQIVHADIKPKNILWDAVGRRASLIDFDIAVDTRRKRPQYRTAGATPEYAPPEQIQNHLVHPTTDVYALGLSCLFLLTGISPDHFLWQGRQVYLQWEDLASTGPAFRYLLEMILTPQLTKREERYRDAMAIQAYYEQEVVKHPAAPLDPVKAQRCGLLADVRAAQNLEALEAVEKQLLAVYRAPFSLYFIGYRCLGLKAFQASLVYLEEAVLRAPQWLSPYFKLATALRFLGRDQEAILLLKKALAHSETEPLSYILIAESYLHQKELKKALGYFQLARKYAPMNTHVLLMMAQVHLVMNQLEAARKLCQEALNIHLFLPKAYQYLQTIAAAFGELDKAEKYGLRALALSPQDATLYYDLGITLYQQARYQDAIRCFLKSLELEPENQNNHYFLGNSYLHLQDFEQAEYYLQIALKTGKETAFIERLLARIKELRQGQADLPRMA